MKNLPLTDRLQRFYPLILVVFAAFLIFSDLGNLKLPPVDDCYYAQKAKEVVQSGDWLTIRFARQLSVDNTPFFIWLIAVAFKVFGVNAYSATFFSALFGVATVVSVYFLGRMLFDEWIGLFASFVLMTTPLFFVFSRRVMVDVTLTFWITLALIFFLQGLKDKRYYLLFGICTGIAILTKSVLGLFPILIALLYLLLKEFRKILDPYFLFGILLAGTVSLPWFLYQYMQYPDEFLKVHLRWLIYQRAFVLPTIGSPAFYGKRLLAGYWPWLPFAAYAFIRFATRNARKIEANSLIMILWPAVVIGVMSFINDKKEHYIMSAFPPLAVLTAISLNGLVKLGKTRTFVVRSTCVLMALTTLVVIIGRIQLPPRLDMRDYFENLVEETCAMAEYAKNHIGKDEKTVLYGTYLWRVRSTYLFYSDRDIPFEAETAESLLTFFRNHEADYCLSTREAFEKLLYRKDLQVHVLKETQSLIFFKAMGRSAS